MVAHHKRLYKLGQISMICVASSMPSHQHVALACVTSLIQAQSDAYTAMLAAAAVTSTVTATTPAIASRSAALPPATQKTHVRSKLGNLKLLKPLQMAYAQ